MVVRGIISRACSTISNRLRASARISAASNRMYPAFVIWFNGTRGFVFRVRELQDICCHVHDLFIVAVYSPRRAAWLHLAR
jgi:hypothetical protein